MGHYMKFSLLLSTSLLIVYFPIRLLSLYNTGRVGGSHYAGFQGRNTRFTLPDRTLSSKSAQKGTIPYVHFTS